MHYKIKKGFSLIKNNQLIEKNYDLVIKTRFDIKLESFINLYDINPKKIYIVIMKLIIIIVHDHLSEYFFVF